MKRRAPRATALDPALLTFAEACEYLRVGETWLRQHKGEIGFVGTGKLLRFERTALDAWIERNRVAPRVLAEVQPRRHRKPVEIGARREGINPVTGKPWGYYDDLTADR